MPLYPYRCTKCGYRFERIQNFSAEPVKECPECGGKLVRLLSAPRLKFKGTGWYVTDYARSGSSASGGSSSSERKSSGASKSSSSESSVTSPSPAKKSD